MKKIGPMNGFAVLLASALTVAVSAHAQDSDKSEKASAPTAAATSDKATAGTNADYVIMKIGDEEIKRSEIEKVWKVIFPGGNAPDFETLDNRIKTNLLRGIANEHILLKEAKKSPLVDSPEVRERVRTAEDQILIQAFLQDKTKDAVSDQKLKELYDVEMKNRPASQEEIHARHILVKTEAEAKAIEKKLKKGADFATLAKEKSDDKASGAAGGDLGWFNKDRMTPEFSAAAFALKKGEVSDPIKTDFGWHIIKAEDRRVAPAPTFDSLKDQLKTQMQRKAVADYVASVTKDQKVTVIDAKGMEKPLPAEPPLPVPAVSGTPPVTPASAPAGQ